MNMHRIINGNYPGVSFLLGCMLLLCTSCDTTRKLPAGEELYTGASIHIVSDVSLKTGSLKTELEKVQRPKSNSSYLGVRPQLWVYTIAGKDKGKGLRHLLKTKAGEAPVLMSQVHPDKTVDLMKNRLSTRGYFQSKITFETHTHKRKTSLLYTVTLTSPYLIHTVSFPSENDSLNTCIRSLEKESVLRDGVQYNLDLFKEERSRIERELKNRGYYYFNADYLLFKADTAQKNKQVNVTLSVKKNIPSKARIAYILGTVYVIPSPVSPLDSIPVKADTLKINGYEYLNSDSSFRPKAILTSVYLKKGELYSRTNHNLTLNHLMGMGVFKFVEIKFVETPDSSGKLDAFIRLLPVPRKSVQADMEAITKSNNYSGPALTLSFKDRNLLKGAELYVFNLLGSFETQFGGHESGLNSYEVGTNSQLYFPEFITPFHLRHVSVLFLPKTKVDVGFRLLQRVSYYSEAAMNGSFGYKWKETAQIEHELDPVSISFTKLLNTTDAFRNLLLDNPFLAKSFQEQFIIGSTYSYTYNTQIGPPRRSQYYFNGSLQLSGNSIYLAQSLFSSHASTEEDPYKVFGYVYSQYSRVTLEGRYFYTINKESKLAARLYGGLGEPYGNSSTMPYVKQFFSGGANSIRAFQARSMGPGSYHIPDSLAGKAFLDQSGDIKLEGNLEYRFNIISMLKGAVFTDAGNVWLSHKNALYPGGEFNPSTFQQQIAVGAGVGLRFDISFLVLRLDLAFPLRKPSLPEDERWVIRQVDFGNPSWRNQNLVLNFAIGYPF
jgi:outer membrane protein insertion porin family